MGKSVSNSNDKNFGEKEFFSTNDRKHDLFAILMEKFSCLWSHISKFCPGYGDLFSTFCPGYGPLL